MCQSCMCDVKVKVGVCACGFPGAGVVARVVDTGACGHEVEMIGRCERVREV